MPDHQPDPRSLNFAGDVDEHGRPLPMAVEVLRGRTEKWPRSSDTPDGVAALLARSRQLYVDGYFTFENFMDATTRSLQAVEAALRVRLDAGSEASFAVLIDRARADGLVNDDVQEILHLGRRFRNDQVHATTMTAITPATAAGMIGASHKLVAELFAESGVPAARDLHVAWSAGIPQSLHQVIRKGESVQSSPHAGRGRAGPHLDRR